MLEANLSWVRMAFFFGGLAFFLLLELILPYRRPSVSKLKRWLINLGITTFNTLILRLVLGSAIVATAAYVTQQKMGVLNLVAMPYWLKLLATLVFMDFMLYIWHLLNHEVPFFWRFHRVHHTDLNMDVSTATRFHLGELAISAGIKIGLVFFLGADLLGVTIFETALVLAAQFHHSSLKVPWWFERLFWLLFVPPSMHRIHHSVKIPERNSNYGTIFSLWDRLLGTMVSRVEQGRIIIGVGGHFDQSELGLHRLLVMPFAPPVP
ncbi:MAG: sterol desaturase family protein [Desulfarculus sp.]|jgi:sterol desaturase/sphingolipid hydroxylase (fatty acid hydroxylase superfamily)|nr:MAG: sterol desaturase family protein [Desulfarculus sp.]